MQVRLFSRHSRDTVAVKPQVGMRGALSGQCADGPDRATEGFREASDGIAVDPAQGRDRQPGAPSQRSPACRAMPWCTGMTERGERRGEKDKVGPGTRRPQQLRRVVGRAGEQAGSAARVRPLTAAQMDPGAQRGRESRVAGDDQGEPTRPAKLRQIAPKRLASRRVVVAQHHARQSPWQTRHSGARIGQPPVVGEQPERREAGAAAPLCGGAAPGEKFGVHGSSQLVHRLRLGRESRAKRPPSS